MYTIDEIREILLDRNLSAVARYSGVSYVTIHKIRQGRGHDIKHKTLLQLSEYLERTKFPVRGGEK